MKEDKLLNYDEIFTEWVGTGYDAYKINYKKEYIRLNNIIKEALRKLRATKDHYKIEDINNAIIHTIKILERSDKVE